MVNSLLWTEYDSRESFYRLQVHTVLSCFCSWMDEGICWQELDQFSSGSRGVGTPVMGSSVPSGYHPEAGSRMKRWR